MRSEIAKKILSENKDSSKILEKAILEHKKKWDVVDKISIDFGIFMWFLTVVSLFFMNIQTALIYLIWSCIGIIVSNFKINWFITFLMLPLFIWPILLYGISYLLMKINYPTLAKIRQEKIKRASKN